MKKSFILFLAFAFCTFAYANNPFAMLMEASKSSVDKKIEICNELTKSSYPKNIRKQAYILLFKESTPSFGEILASKDSLAISAYISFANKSDSQEILNDILNNNEQLSDEQKLEAINLFTNKSFKASLQFAKECAKSSNEYLSKQALFLLSKIGDKNIYEFFANLNYGDKEYLYDISSRINNNSASIDLFNLYLNAKNKKDFYLNVLIKVGTKDLLETQFDKVISTKDVNLIRAMAKFADLNDIDKFMQCGKNYKDIDNIIIVALREILSNKNAGDIKIIDNYNCLHQELKIKLLPLFSLNSDNDCLAFISEQAKSDNKSISKAALKVLGKWKNSGAFVELLKFIDNETAQNSCVNLARTLSSFKSEKDKDCFISILELLKDKDAKSILINSKLGEIALDKFAWDEQEKYISLNFRGDVLWRLNIDKNFYRTYMYPVKTLSGGNLVVSSPPDHHWHNALFFQPRLISFYDEKGEKIISKENYWEKIAYEKGITISELKECILNDDFSAKFVLEIKYFPKDKPELVLNEHRIINVSKPENGIYKITHQISLKSERKFELSTAPLEGVPPEGNKFGGYALYSLRISSKIENIKIFNLDGGFVDSYNNPAQIDSILGKKSFAIGLSGILDNSKIGSLAIIDSKLNDNSPTDNYVICNNLKAPERFVFISFAYLRGVTKQVQANEELKLTYQAVVIDGKIDKQDLAKYEKEFNK